MLFNPPGRRYGFRTLMLDPVRSAVELRLGGMVAALPALGGTMRRPVSDSWEDAELTIVLDAGGVETGDARRNEHIRSLDALDVANHPQMRFRGCIARRPASVTLEVRGLLTFRGQYMPVILEADCRDGSTGAHRLLARGMLALPQQLVSFQPYDRARGHNDSSRVEIVIQSEWLETSDPMPAA